ncbi:MAG: phospholipase D family protein [Deltaproteobacteria bacterium]|nr:MAG: phospholipase D family protein [Deltaproteobacteria bacterium]
MLRKYFIIILMTALGLFLINSCATLPKDFDRPPSYAFTDTDSTRLGTFRGDEVKAHPGQSGFVLLGDGLDAFVARAVLANHAERSIDVQYYLYHKDLVGLLFTDLLLKAADRGVRVRLLVDDMDLADRDLSAAVVDSHPNIEVRIFNPFSRKTGRTSQFVSRMGSVTRRMHNKTFTVDNQACILGGRNIGNEYFEADPDLAFADLDVLAIGPVAQKVSSSFDQYWNSELAYPVSVLIDKPPTPEEIQQTRQQWNELVAQQADSEYLQALRNSSLAKKFRNNQVVFHWGEAVVIYDQPEKILKDFDQTEYHLAPQLRPYWKSVEKELIIFSPYFVPGKPGTAFLTQLAQRGVRVRILTNSLASNDVGIVHAGYSKYRKDLLRAGVELYEMNMKLTREQRKEKRGKGGSSKASLHAKSFVFDRNKIFIGSLNLDPRAFLHNTEIGVVISSAEIASGMGDWFDQNIEKIAFRLELTKNKNGTEQLLWYGLVDGKEHTFDVDPYTGFWRRFGISILSIMPIESQL